MLRLIKKAGLRRVLFEFAQESQGHGLRKTFGRAAQQEVLPLILSGDAWLDLHR